MRLLYLAFGFALALPAQPPVQMPPAQRPPMTVPAPPPPQEVIYMGRPRISDFGSLQIHHFTLRDFIATAYHISLWQIAGGERWMQNERFDFLANPASGIDPPIKVAFQGPYQIEDERLRAMLQRFLVAKFAFEGHHEARNSTVYLLEKSDKPLRLEAVEEHGGSDLPPGLSYSGGFRITSMSMDQLAVQLSYMFLHVPVLNRTGLAGTYDYAEKPGDEYSRFNEGSVRQFILGSGLKLTKTQLSVEWLIIDHAVRPSSN